MIELLSPVDIWHHLSEHPHDVGVNYIVWIAVPKVRWERGLSEDSIITSFADDIFDCLLEKLGPISRGTSRLLSLPKDE